MSRNENKKKKSNLKKEKKGSKGNILQNCSMGMDFNGTERHKKKCRTEK